MFKNYKFIIGTVMVVGLALMAYFMYLLSKNGNMNALMFAVMLLLGLVLGGLISFLLVKNSAEPPVISENSHTIAESMRKVFKVVSAEGHFSEIYNYEETSKIFHFIPSTKKALVIVQAKVLIGYDFEKFRWEVDEHNRRVKLLYFPPPEILSTETDYKYYNIEEQFFNLFSKDDLAKIQHNSKNLIIDAAQRSHLPQVAAEQMRTLLTELLDTKNFSLENAYAIEDAKNKIGANPEKKEV